MAKLSDRAAGAVGSLGEYLAEQRRNAQLSLRQLSDLAGVSNPYLSQIERGLRKPSAEVLQQLAKALRISAETLYVRAGILDPDDGPDGSGGRAVSGVVDAVLLDPALTERQKRVLLDVYTSFVRENTPEEASEPPANKRSRTTD
ncbi:helix-turn-helix domain-containing protein [Kribbella shirazensis]|uniref:Transcriptional regulator with XRE-family HTH domain n=1 Tax=Kribbella shirazensis TaxID=1105143 RepID=A0A7X5V5U2_9ACTN|nr:helix-turn-helix transcriptional regulator [Kribbella shirazensis]NIK54458.1 transcriptional regulator with XRE-family HTH domain [Kribbella shirazensis]